MMELTKPFVQATVDVFKTMLDMDITDQTVESVEIPGEGVTVSIGIVGDYKGFVTYVFPQQTSLEIARSLSGMDVMELDSFVTSVISEMTNIISGNAVTYLSQENCVCDICPPEISTGAHADCIGGNIEGSSEFGTPAGPLHMRVSLTKK